MNAKPRLAVSLILIMIFNVLTSVGCASSRPRIAAVALDRNEVPRYASLEMTITLEAQYDNPYDSRQVRLDGVFTAADGSEMTVPGFWDGEFAWRLRFTPPLEGEWTYALTVHDDRGESQPFTGTFNVSSSELHGWLQVGSWVDPAYSSHYLVYDDGTPFYGIGHCDALNILIDGYDPETGVGLFNDMLAANENFIVWWPLYSNSPIKTGYDQYSVSDMRIIDMVIQDAQEKGIFLVFTIWDHPELRDETHSWDRGRWSTNGFSRLGSIDSFFTSDEAWAWQENFYRYLIARWGYSPAVGLWQTVSEINGTNAYDQTNPWHERVNAYFVANDPYRHPTTASMSGDIDWPEGFETMDVPQVNVYALEDPVVAAETIADWTRLMWDRVARPNWVGEFGVPGNAVYPELFHNSIWAALGAGAAMSPAEWNSGGAWGRLTTEMKADLYHLARFVADTPLAWWNPSPLQVESNDPQVRGWGVAGLEGGLLWVQDFSLQGQPIETIRLEQAPRIGIRVTVAGLAAGTYVLTPFDTWQGIYLDPFEATCPEGGTCTFTLPAFTADMAFRIERK